MYIQQNRTGPALPFSLPRDYSGSAFRPDESEEPPLPPSATDVPNIEEDLPTVAPASPEESAPEALSSDPGEGEQETLPAFAPRESQGGDGRASGLLARFPFLSSLLPPPRKHRREKEGGLPEWAMIAALLLLLTNDNEEDDILPFLILLLLWN